MEKIVGKDKLKEKISRLKRQGKIIAFTNGCFDILHYGHVSYLRKAKKNNRILIIGLNSDKSVKRIKGPKRPIIGQKQRAELLAALDFVDFITIFNEDTPQKLIEYINPDILIKGADWKGRKIAGEDFIRKNRGKVEYIKYISNLSTSNIIKKIIKSEQN